MEKIQTIKQYDLEERTYEFASKCKDFVQHLPRTISNLEYSRQLVRSSGSVAANYIEANESISRKDFVHRIKICRKESKETRLWLRLCDIGKDETMERKQKELIAEALELTKIFGSISEKSK
jgi:four helix bundle protein